MENKIKDGYRPGEIASRRLATIRTLRAPEIQVATTATHITQEKLATQVASSDPAEREVGKKAVVARENLDTGVQGVKKETQIKDKKLRVEVAPSADLPITLEKDKNGVALDSMLRLIADIDGAGGVESKNVGWFGRNLMGKGEQKWNFGELQIYESLKRNCTTKASLDALATRLGATLPWNTHLDEISIQRDTGLNTFRTKLRDRVDEMATLGQLVLNDRGARAGLEAVISGNESGFKQALEGNKDALKKAAMAVSAEPGKLEWLLNALAKIGILLPLTILGKYGLLVSADEKQVTKTGNKGGLEAKFAEFGEAGNLTGAIKGIGLQLDINANDPSQRIQARTARYIEAITGKKQTPTQAAQSIVERARSEASDEVKQKLENISTSYLALQSNTEKQFDVKTMDVNMYHDILSDQTFRYLAQVEELRGFQFKGGFVGVTPALIGAGLSWSRLDTSYTAKGVNDAAGRAEALATKKEFKDASQKKAYLSSLGLRYDYNQGTKSESLILPKNIADGIKTDTLGATVSKQTDGSVILTFPADKTFGVQMITNADGSRAYEVTTLDKVRSSTVATATSTPTVAEKIQEKQSSKDIRE